MINYFRFASGILLAALLTACGGGGGSAGTAPGGSAVGTTTVSLAVPTAIEIFSSSQQLSSVVGSTTSFTVVVKDVNNQAIPNQTVTFRASSGNLGGALPAPRTGESGQAITSVFLSPGNDQSNREIDVTAVAGSISQSIKVAVKGTTLSLAGDSAVLAGGNTTFTAKALDDGGKAIVGASLAVASSNGNTVAPRTVVTDAQGAAKFAYSGTNAGLDTLTVTGLGTSARTPVSVSADDFRFESPPVNSSVVVGGTLSATVRLVSNGAPAAGRVVTFSSTRGTVSPVSVTTDTNGRAATVISSQTSGPATIIAQATSTQVALPITFVAVLPASLVLQANPGAVPPNSGPAALNQSALRAVVRDSAGNPVQGQIVNFTAITDGSNGTISPGSGVTDNNGTVVSQFIPGAITTANNGVVIRASVQGSTVSGTASLTVSGQALFISIGVGNQITNLTETTYQKEFSVYVTDANGAPAGDRVVNLSVLPDQFGKGRLRYFEGPPAGWGYDGVPTFCPNEDVNRDGVLNVGEDVSGDGRLTPGLPVTVSPASVTTAANGFAKFFLQYGENFVPWIDATITARAGVGGSESVQTQRYFLDGLASDFTSAITAPAGQVSPFGTGACNSPN